MTREQVKYTLIVLGTLDLFSVYRTYDDGLNILLAFFWGETSTMEGMGFVNAILILNTILTLSLVVTGLSSIAGLRISYLVYYFQFPLRLIFFTLTFDFILSLPGLQMDTWIYKILLAIVVTLEIVRLIFTIKTRKIMFGTRETASP
jgi:hypothetical protein